MAVEQNRDRSASSWDAPNATPQEIIEAFADRAAIEQDFHDVKKIWGAARYRS